jgi:hypothetical protein
VLPNADHHGQRARLFVAPLPKPDQTKHCCELMQPNPLPIPPSRARCLAPAFSQSPAPSRINAAAAPRNERVKP